MLEEDAAVVDRFVAILMPHLRIGSPEDRAAVRGTFVKALPSVGAPLLHVGPATDI